MTELTERVLHYQQTGSGYESLRRLVEQWVYYFPITRPGFNEEDCADFFLLVRCKLPSLLSRYTHGDRSFEAYLAKTLRWQLRSYARRRCKSRRMRQLARSPEVWAGLIGVAESPQYEPPAPEPLTYKLTASRLNQSSQATGSKRIVILTMKAALFVTDEQLDEVARLSGESFKRLRRCRDELAELVGRREQRRHMLRERRNSAFFRMLLAEEELTSATNEQKRVSLREELERQSQRLKNARFRLARVPMVPTNGEIATALGVPKGSVDSALHYMKRNFSRLTYGEVG
ncbi:MAG: hypothetical protein ACQETQ_05395 [Spirochaetota bacterium]